LKVQKKYTQQGTNIDYNRQTERSLLTKRGNHSKKVSQ